MSRVSTQIAVGVLQFAIATLQVFHMILTWRSLNSAQSSKTQHPEAAETAMATQHTLETSFAEVNIALPQLLPSVQRRWSIRDHMSTGSSACQQDEEA
ncbi:hypothetical protein F5B18DRAFT_650020 [Nemania serpens]|nr:hypothetical protein F5B18DRAFT_650020 [Nemania serpens]